MWGRACCRKKLNFIYFIDWGRCRIHYLFVPKHLKKNKKKTNLKPHKFRPSPLVLLLQNCDSYKCLLQSRSLAGLLYIFFKNRKIRCQFSRCIGHICLMMITFTIFLSKFLEKFLFTTPKIVTWPPQQTTGHLTTMLYCAAEAPSLMVQFL